MTLQTSRKNCAAFSTIEGEVDREQNSRQLPVPVNSCASSAQPSSQTIDYSSHSSAIHLVPQQPWVGVGLPKSHLYPAGVEIFTQGTDSLEVFFVQSGLLKLLRSEGNGHEIVLDLRFRGSFVGSAAAIRSTLHPFSAITLTSCELTRVERETFLHLLTVDASLSERVRDLLSEEVLNQVARISQFACLSARQRLELVQRQGCTSSTTKFDPLF